MKNKGACFGQVAGFESPLWYAIDGNKPEFEYSFGYQNWYESAKYETINTRNNVGLFELTPFVKFELKGEMTHPSLQYLCSNNISRQ